MATTTDNQNGGSAGSWGEGHTDVQQTMVADALGIPDDRRTNYDVFTTDLAGTNATLQQMIDEAKGKS
jgi:hypothetical protein